MVENNNTKISAKDVDVFYSEKQALNKISMDIKEKEVTALIAVSYTHLTLPTKRIV